MGETVQEAFARIAEELRVGRLNVKCDECGEVGCNRASCALLAAGHEPTLCGQWTRDPEWHVSHCCECRLQSSGMPRMLCGAYSWERAEHLSRCRECRLQRARARNLVERLRWMAEATQSDDWTARLVRRRRVEWSEAYRLGHEQFKRLLARSVRIEAKYLKEGT